MGSEVVVMLIPLGVLLFGLLSYRAARGPERIYPVGALITSTLAAAYIASQARDGFFVWFLIWFALVSVPVGAVAHIIQWLVRRVRPTQPVG